MSSDNTFTLDGREIPFCAGDSIMDAALRAGEYIPHLCHHPDFAAHGSCRVCMVNVNGRQQAACTQPATAAATVLSQTEELQRQRRSLVQMLFVEGNHVCPGCEVSGACQLQAVAYYLEMLEPHYPHFFPLRRVDASHAQTLLDFNRCILCELCVRASDSVDHKQVFSISGRGRNAHLVINSASGLLGDSTFSASDRAAQVCPVGVILPKHSGYRRPIGQRLYDLEPINRVGDAAAQRDAPEQARSEPHG